MLLVESLRVGTTRMGMITSTQDGSGDFGGMPERRRTSRFPLCEAATYRLFRAGTVRMRGTGRTLNIGSRGILFTTWERLPLGRKLELSVDWPARLDGTCPLRLVAEGRVVRAEADKAAIRIQRYTFKTRGYGR